MEYIAQALQNLHCSGDGPFTKRCQSLLEERLGSAKALLTTSCTDALEMSAILLDLQPGDEVILPSFTFVSSANAFVLRGAKPIFVDIRPDTLNMDERLVERMVTPKTKAILPVHYAGVGCEMDRICSIAAEHGIAVIEDNAHGLWGEYKGRALGTFGDLATLSFHETKNISCGEGGALLVNNSKFAERAEILREKGTNRTRFLRGQVDKYSWVDLGSSYVLSDMLAAFLYGQLEEVDRIQALRRRAWNYYHERLAGMCSEHGVGLPHVPTKCHQPCHMFYLLMRSLEERQALITALRAKGIHAVFHYVPLHTSEMARRLGLVASLPVTEDVSARLVRLPFYNTLTESDQDRVIDAIDDFLGSSII